jgi:hypothetical protein
MASQNKHKLSCGKITVDERITQRNWRPTELNQDNTRVLNDSADVEKVLYTGGGEAPSYVLVSFFIDVWPLGCVLYGTLTNTLYTPLSDHTLRLNYFLARITFTEIFITMNSDSHMTCHPHNILLYSLIPQSVHNQFSTECDLVLPPSISSSLSIP